MLFGVSWFSRLRAAPAGGFSTLLLQTLARRIVLSACRLNRTLPGRQTAAPRRRDGAAAPRCVVFKQGGVKRQRTAAGGGDNGHLQGRIQKDGTYLPNTLNLVEGEVYSTVVLAWKVTIWAISGCSEAHVIEIVDSSSCVRLSEM